MALSILPEREIGAYYQVFYVEPADEYFIYEFLCRHGRYLFGERVAGGVVDALGFEEPEPFPHGKKKRDVDVTEDFLGVRMERYNARAHAFLGGRLFHGGEYSFMPHVHAVEVPDGCGSGVAYRLVCVV